MTGPIGGLDHVIVGVADLEAARDTWKRLGFTVSPRGRHFGWGTANYCIMFEGVYIELLGIVDPQQFTNNLDKKLAESGEGLLSLSYATGDAKAAYKALKPLGALPPKALKRALELPTGQVEPQFELVHLPPQATPGAASFFINHLTPELVWQDAWLGHANGALGLSSVSLCVADPGEAGRAYAKIFGGDAVTPTTAGVAVRIEDSILNLQPARPGEAEGSMGFDVGVGDRRQTAAVLQAAEIPFTLEEETIRINAADACGVALGLVDFV